jgi:hypothetical protein
LNREGDELEKESKIINEKIAQYNKEFSLHKKELFPNSSYTQQLVDIELNLEQKSKTLEEKIKIHNNKAQSFKAKCNLAIKYR